MKRSLRYLPLLFILFFAQSCVKSVIVPSNAPVTGTWVLSESYKSNGNGWYYFNTGLENGVFDFYNNGGAQYDDGFNLMRGSWSIRTISSGYYDQYGAYYNDLHDSFEIHVYDSYTKGSADLYFDDVIFTGNKIIATNYNGGTISKYVFRRY
ncbi:MAG: hypothetical protein V4450_14095 [Bacteroidota bacterium]